MKNSKTALFAFRGDAMCFIHVLLNAMDMNEKGHETTIVFEGESVTLIPEMEKDGHFLNMLYLKAKNLGLFYGACKACSAKLKVDKAVQEAGIDLVGDMSGHPSMADFMDKGFTVITF